MAGTNISASRRIAKVYQLMSNHDAVIPDYIENEKYYRKLEGCRNETCYAGLVEDWDDVEKNINLYVQLACRDGKDQSSVSGALDGRFEVELSKLEGYEDIPGEISTGFKGAKAKHQEDIPGELNSKTKYLEQEWQMLQNTRHDASVASSDEFDTKDATGKTVKEKMSEFGLEENGNKHKGKIDGKHEIANQNLDTPKSKNRGPSWRTAEGDDLVALVAQRSKECLINCDLPPIEHLPSIGSETWGSDFSKDKDSDTSILTSLQSISVSTTSSSSAGHSNISDEMTSELQSQKSILSFEKSKSMGIRGLKYRSASCTGLAQAAKYGPELLGEALCRSQSRAREAEKAAAEACMEKERIENLLLKEASASYAYKQWISSLQVENMCLRMRHGIADPLFWMQKTILDPAASLPCLCGHRLKAFSKADSFRNMQKHISGLKRLRHKTKALGSEVVMGCTLGLAFVLGVSIAGVGLMLGWSMGWICFAF